MDGWLKDILVTGAAVGGLLLGIINLGVTLWSRKTQLRVKAVDHPRGSITEFGIELVNLSPFSVTVVEAGLARAEPFEQLRAKFRPARVAVSRIPIHATDKTGERPPIQLKAGESITLAGDVQQCLTADMPLRRVYVQLATGEIFYGEGPALEKLRRGQRAMQAP